MTDDSKPRRFGFGREQGFRLALAWFATVLASAGAPAFAERPADSLLKLAPADSGMVLAVEEFRAFADRVGRSPQAGAFARLPTVLAWQNSADAKPFHAFRKQVETVVGVSWKTIRDDVFGDAVVLALHMAPDRPVEEARGVLMVRPRDPKLLRRLIQLMNDAQNAQGMLEEVKTVEYRGRSYVVRRFKGGNKRLDCYAIFEDGVLVWSNDEALVKGAIDRKLDGSTSLLDRPEFVEFRDGMPQHSAAMLYVDPRTIERLIVLTPTPTKSEDQRSRAVALRALKALRGAGLAVEWRDGLLLHSREILDPNAVPEWIKTWGGRTDSADALARRIPRGSVVVLAGLIDLSAAYEGVLSLLNDDEKPRLELLLQAARCALAGEDPVRSIFPKVGPAAVVYLDAPSGVSPARFDVVGAVQLFAGNSSSGGLTAALDNALRTILTLYALDPKRQAMGLRVEMIERKGRRLTRIAGGPTPFVYAFGPGWLAVGSTVEGVGRFDSSIDDNNALAKLRKVHFPDARWSAGVDLARLAELAKANRADLLGRFGGEREFEQSVALLELFPTAFAAMTIDPKFRSIHRVIGLVDSVPAK